MTSEQRIEEWAEEVWGKMPADSYSFKRRALDVLESAARTLIASVRAEAIEEAAKVCVEPQVYAGGASISRKLAWKQCAAAIRALVKERKG